MKCAWLLVLACFAPGFRALHAQTGGPAKDAGEKKLPAETKKIPLDKSLPELKFSRWTTSECLIDATYKDKDEQGRPIGTPYLEVKATYAFETIKDNTLVFLGLKGAQPTTPLGTFAGGTPHLVPNDEGQFLLVPKAGKYPRLVLNLLLEVSAKAGSPERSLELGLPGAPSTRVLLRLPTSVKKLRWNERDDEQVNAAGVWDLKWFGTEKSLRAQWKEASPTPVGLAMSKAETLIDVRLEKSHTEMTGSFALDLQRGQTKEWQLWLPPQCKVTTPPDWEWTIPEGKPGPFLLKSKKGPTSERVAFTFQVVVPRAIGQQKVVVGPFLVVGATQSEGSITIRAAAEVLQGHRLFYNRLGELYPREPAKAISSDAVAQFQFQANPFANKPMPANKALLEIDVKPERAIHEVLTFHDVKLRAETGQMLLETESRFVTKAAAALEIDVLLPPVCPWDVQAAAVAPLAGSLAALPLALCRYPLETIFPAHISSPEDGGPMPPVDANRRVKLHTIKNVSGDWEARLQMRYLVPPGVQRLQLELPRPSGALDRGGKATLTVPSQFEWTARTRGIEEPMGAKLVVPFDQAPAVLDAAWRNFVPEIPASSRAVVNIQGNTIHVQQTISVPRPKGPVSILDNKTLALMVPAEVSILKLIGTGTIKDREEAPPLPGSIWHIKPNIDAADRVEVELEYFVTPIDAGGNMRFALPLLWPDKITWKQATVSFFADAGVFPRVAANPALARLWHVIGAPAKDVAGGDRVPALVLTAAGNELPLVIELDKPVGFKPPTMVCDRSEIEVRVDEEGAQTYSVQFSVQKLASPSLDVEFPVSGTEVAMGKSALEDRGKRTKLIWEGIPGRPNAARLKLKGNESKIEFQYTIPASQTMGKRFWQTTFYPPRFPDDVFLGRVHWNIAIQESQVPVVLGNVQVDYRWGLPRWLLGPESPDHAYSIMLVRDRLEPQRLYHPGWQPWILMCSGGVLFFGIVFLMLRDSRLWSWTLATTIIVGLGAAAWFSPYFLLPFFWGAQAGLAVLALVGGVHWFLQERYRRQLIFLPGFSRGQPGSTLSRGKKPREPSTIDAPLSHGTGSGS